MWLVREDGMKLAAAADHLHQRYALAVVHSLAGPWTPAGGLRAWGSPVHECEWEGVGCEGIEELEGERGGPPAESLASGAPGGIKIDLPRRAATRLTLRQRLASGDVPPELSLLYYLRHLDLENSGLAGALPVPIYGLVNLRTLYLEQNELTNVDAIGDFERLEHLSLSRNNFRGPLPESFGRLTRLRTLYVHTNGFTGDLFGAIGNLASLELLDAAFNGFGGTIPPRIGDAENLTGVFLGHNGFGGSIPEDIGRCKKLEQFQIDGCPAMDGPIPSAFGSLPRLEFLKLDTCGFGGMLPANLGDLTKLAFLDVSSNDLTGEVPSKLGGATALETLVLANNGLQGEVPSALGDLVHLEKLYLQGTDLSGSVPREVCALRDSALDVLRVPFDVECDASCCTDCT